MKEEVVIENSIQIMKEERRFTREQEPFHRECFYVTGTRFKDNRRKGKEGNCLINQEMPVGESVGKSSHPMSCLAVTVVGKGNRLKRGNRCRA